MTDAELADDADGVICTRCGMPGADPGTGTHCDVWECGNAVKDSAADLKLQADLQSDRDKIKQVLIFAVGVSVGMIIRAAYT